MWCVWNTTDERLAEERERDRIKRDRENRDRERTSRRSDNVSVSSSGSGGKRRHEDGRYQEYDYQGANKRSDNRNDEERVQPKKGWTENAAFPPLTDKVDATRRKVEALRRQQKIFFYKKDT